MSFAYLSIPYNSKNADPELAAAERDARMVAFWRAAAFLIEGGIHVVSPMTLEPALRAAPSIPYDWTHWQEYSLKMMGISSQLIVLDLPGWEESTGVAGEIAEATRMGIAVIHLKPERVEDWFELLDL